MLSSTIICPFCQIIKGKAPCHKIWEDDKHIAFLSIFPNTPGFTVVATKLHLSSYVLDLPDDVLSNLILASKAVANILDTTFDDVGRTGLILEGFGVDHAHTKLFPMHGTKAEKWERRRSNVDKFFTHYEGYISSHDYKRADDRELAQLALKIRRAQSIGASNRKTLAR